MASITIYSECSPLELGCHIFTDIGQTTPLTSTWISDGYFKYQLDGDGVIVTKQYCETNGFIFQITLTDPTTRDAYPGEEIEPDPITAAKTFTLPLEFGDGTGFTYNGYIDWGDNSMSPITSFSGNSHTYAAFGTYTLTITGQVPAWSFATYPHDKWKISDILYWGGTGIGNWEFLQGAFQNCQNLKSTGQGTINGSIIGNYSIFGLCEMFKGCTSLTGITSTIFDDCTDFNLSFGNIFEGCTSLTTIPSGLFDNVNPLTMYMMFSGCTSLTTIPSGLFDNMTSTTIIDYMFKHCTALETIPDNLFRLNTSVTSFRDNFYGCNKLQINPWTFYANGESGTRFLNKSVMFQNCFYRTSFTGTQGTAPDLWNCNFGSGTPVKTLCFGGAGNSLTSISNYNSIPAAWK